MQKKNAYVWLIMYQYPWLIMHQYPWISLSFLKNAWINCSDYAWALKYLIIFHVRHVFEDVSGSKYVTIIPEYVSVCLNDPQYARTCMNNDLSMAEYCLMSLNMFENIWVNCSDYSRVLNMSHHLRYFSICLRY